MKQGEDVVALIKERADIVQIIGETVELRRSGSRYVGLCPFHGEKTPSFSVTAGEQFFHCFGCGESGDVLSYVMKYYALSFPEALKMLAERYGVVLPERKQSAQEKALAEKRKKMFALNEKVAAIYGQYLRTNRGAGAARDYLVRRGVGKKISADYGLCYAPSQDVEGWHFLGGHLAKEELVLAAELGLVSAKENGGYYDRFRDRILFPIRDIAGQICGFGGRIIGEGQPKYMNSPESLIFNKSSLLLGLYQQKEDIRRAGSVVFVEGNFDLISLVGAGVKNVVAPLGTALTREHLRLVKRFAEGAVMLFDGDKAGVQAAVRSVPLFLGENLMGKVSLLPEGEDPDTYVRRHGGRGILELLAEASPLPEFAFENLVQEHGLSLDGKSRVIEGLKPLVQAATSSLQRSVILSHFAEKLGLDVISLERNLQTGEGGPAQKNVLPSSVPVITPLKQKKTEAVLPLDSVQRRFVQFMVLHPSLFDRLVAMGMRNILLGSVGEIIFLHMTSLLRKHRVLEPEEFLGLLPKGVERKVVAEILLKQGDGLAEGDDPLGELAELEAYLEVALLKKKSNDILLSIQGLDQVNELDKLQDLLLEKMAVELELQGVLENFQLLEILVFV
ncbi:DNA primase [Desulfotalea psychrophila]|uniref:DNA primase n=1 Tax=Desulfotalea psychrophila (strain LSv54 / DSM 12343) TaxID=177439 RepID=Q6AQ52_DESPS|nr:DNA primase [Desulfotalea psychrophila]CAG35521.1 related to DNA primase (DnaG) [Desulfotalea psychrophila LSv54]